MSQLARKPTHPPPQAAQSIAACRALFDGEATLRKLRAVFDALPDRSRGLVLIAGGLPARDYQRDFESFDELELQQVREGLRYLKQMVVRLDNALGDVRRLKHYQFSRTQ